MSGDYWLPRHSESTWRQAIRCLHGPSPRGFVGLQRTLEKDPLQHYYDIEDAGLVRGFSESGTTTLLWETHPTLPLKTTL